MCINWTLIDGLCRDCADDDKRKYREMQGKMRKFLPSVLESFNKKYPYFSHMRILTEDEFKILYDFFDKNRDTSKWFGILAGVDTLLSEERRILPLFSTEQAVSLSNLIDSFGDFSEQTVFYHLILPCVFDVIALDRHPDMKGQDRVHYYLNVNIFTVTEIWSIFRFSRAPNKFDFQTNCPICLENVFMDREIVDLRTMFQK